MAYQTTTAGGNYANPGTGDFPGTNRGAPPSGLPAEWRNAVVVTAAAAPAVQYSWPLNLGSPARMTTASQMLLDFDTSESDASQVEQLQQLLWRGGFYGDDTKPKFTPGEKDDYTRNAFIQAVKEASRARKPFGDFLDERMAARVAAIARGDISTGPQRAPFSPQVSSPIDVRATVQAAAQKVLGMDLPPDKVAQFVAEFQNAQVGAQRSAYDTTATGGTSVAAPDLSSFAMEAARRADPVKADARTSVHVASVIEKMMAGGQ